MISATGTWGAGVKGGFCFKMGVICSLMVEEVNDAGGQEERKVLEWSC